MKVREKESMTEKGINREKPKGFVGDEKWIT